LAPDDASVLQNKGHCFGAIQATRKRYGLLPVGKESLQTTFKEAGVRVVKEHELPDGIHVLGGLQAIGPDVTTAVATVELAPTDNVR
jgi:hypothetical protein